MATAAQRHNAVHNEGGYGYNPHAEAEKQAAIAKSDARIQHILDNFDDYRAKWNAAVAKYTVNGRLNMRDLPKIEKEAGITQNEVMLAKSRVQA